MTAVDDLNDSQVLLRRFESLRLRLLQTEEPVGLLMELGIIDNIIKDLSNKKRDIPLIKSDLDHYTKNLQELTQRIDNPPKH